MATKNQIARRMYDTSYDNLTPGEKSAVSKRYNAQATEVVHEAPIAAGNVVMVKFARPGVNGTKECAVEKGKTLQQALDQAGLTLNTKKEGVIEKNSGRTVTYSQPVEDGKTYFIVPGVDSSRY